MSLNQYPDYVSRRIQEMKALEAKYADSEELARQRAPKPTFTGNRHERRKQARLLKGQP